MRMKATTLAGSVALVSLLALPVVAATTLGALRINQSMDDMQQLDNMRLLTDMTKQATELAQALQEERDKSAGPLAPSRVNSISTTGGVFTTIDAPSKRAGSSTSARPID